MIYFALTSLSASLLSFCIGSFVLYLNPKNSLNRLYCAISMCLFYWSFIEFGCRQAESYQAARVWLTLMSFWPFTIAVLLHFILVFTEKSKIVARRFSYVLIYLPAVVFTFAYLTMNPEVRGPVKAYWGWTFKTPTELSVSIFADIWVFVVAVCTYAACISYYKKVVDHQRKQQAIYVFLGVSMPVFLGIITEIILPWLGVRVPELTTVGFLFACAFIGYAIWKYQLFNLTPVTAADEIISTMPDALLLVDTENRILSVNKSALNMLGYPENEILKQSINAVFKESDDLIEKINTKGKISDVETVMIKKDQRKIPVSLSASMVSRKSDVNYGIVFIAKDITRHKKAEEEKKKLEAQLFQSQKMEALGTMASGVAHDFNNSLGAIVLNTEMSLEDAPANSEQKISLEHVLTASRRAQKLVRQILTFSRDEEVNRKPMDISGIVLETLDMLRAMLPTSIDIHPQIDPNVDHILADSTQIQQLVINLCSNAAHAMRDMGGKLEVKLNNINDQSTDPDGELKLEGFVQLVVKDYGQGIAPEIQERVFDPFFSTKNPGEGTGLGLSVVHGIVASHEGKITLKTEPGKGTIFSIHFPGIEKGQARIFKEERPLPSGSETILFIDDEEALVDAGKRMLERLGYHVHPATHAKEALKIFKMQPDAFDLIITDLTMPHMTGIELSKSILDIRPHMPIIICTGFSNLVKPKEIKELGIKAYIIKPFVKRKLAEAVRKVLDDAMMR